MAFLVAYACTPRPRLRHRAASLISRLYYIGSAWANGRQGSVKITATHRSLANFCLVLTKPVVTSWAKPAVRLVLASPPSFHTVKGYH